MCSKHLPKEELAKLYVLLNQSSNLTSPKESNSFVISIFMECIGHSYIMKNSISCIARRMFNTHFHFSRSCCHQHLTMWSKFNLVGTYQNQIFIFSGSICLFLSDVLLDVFIILMYFQNLSDVLLDMHVLLMFSWNPFCSYLMFFQIWLFVMMFSRTFLCL